MISYYSLRMLNLSTRVLYKLFFLRCIRLRETKLVGRNKQNKVTTIRSLSLCCLLIVVYGWHSPKYNLTTNSLWIFFKLSEMMKSSRIKILFIHHAVWVLFWPWRSWEPEEKQPNKCQTLSTGKPWQAINCTMKSDTSSMLYKNWTLMETNYWPRIAFGSTNV